jgi:hypothetical protein
MGCHKKLHMMHFAGCPTYSAMSFVNFMKRNSWIGAFTFMFLGLMAGLFGIRFFT